MTAKFQIQYYLTSTGRNPIKNFLDRLNNKQQSKILRIFQSFEELGIAAVKHYSKKLSGTDLWETRILGKDNIRVIYVIPIHATILVLHGFVKKTQKIPLKELKTANERYKEWQQRNQPD